MKITKHPLPKSQGVPKLSEKSVENLILEVLVGHLGFHLWKNQSVGIYDPGKGIFRRPSNKYHIKGVADLLGCHLGRFIAIEIKAKGGRVSKEQAEFMLRTKHSGGIAFVAYSLGEVMEKLCQEFPEDAKLVTYARQNDFLG